MKKEQENDELVEVECDECGFGDTIKKSDFSEVCHECGESTLVVNQYDY